LILDTESVPDGELLSRVRYADASLTPEEAVARAQAEARARSGEEFLPVTFQQPVAVCVLRVGQDFSLQALACLDAPLFRPAEMVRLFWLGVGRYRPKLVTFNGRSFDLPLLELAAFRHGLSLADYLQKSRDRQGGNHLDLMDWLSNYGACPISGGLNLLAKMLNKPGKLAVTGDQVYSLWRAGRVQEINDYCLFDTLDTYFVFLRTRVMLGELSLSDEAALVRRAKIWLTARVPEFPALQQYLQAWGE
jgi:predicted PolB exonuclease-like 3'-5' exonuclease